MDGKISNRGRVKVTVEVERGEGSSWGGATMIAKGYAEREVALQDDSLGDGETVSIYEGLIEDTVKQATARAGEVFASQVRIAKANAAAEAEVKV